MSFRIVRNDITKISTEAIVNTANEQVDVGEGCDMAIYEAAGYTELLEYRRKYIGPVLEGESFITPGFGLKAKYIIHTVSPFYFDGNHNEEEKLRSCYRNSLRLAKENGIHEISFPLISTGSYGYPKEKGMRIAIDEISAFLLSYDMDIVLVVYDYESTMLGKHINPDLDLQRSLEQRMHETPSTFSQYLLYLIESKGLQNADVYHRAIVDKKIFSKIKNNPDYHPQKKTALCLCIGAMLNLEETKELLARAGYASSPCDKMDILFTYFIEHEIYDMIELDIQLEELGLPCIIT